MLAVAASAAWRRCSLSTRPTARMGGQPSRALASGVTAEELVELLIALAPVLGSARVVSAAPKLGLALGYDVEADIEGLDAGPERG